MTRLNELRKSSSILPKKNGVTQLKEFVEANIKESEYSQYYISFTTLEKLGINPNSPYSTPNGIYSYPLKYVLKQIENELEYGTDQDELTFDEVVPFAGDADYFNLFKSKVKPLDLADAEACNRVIEIIKQKFNLPNLPESYFQSSPGFRVWSYSMFAINGQSPHARLNARVQSKTWPNMFRSIGVPAVIDSAGAGIIHESEPTQAVFFSSEYIQLVKRFVNHERSGSTEKDRDLVKQTTTRVDANANNPDQAALKRKFIELVIKTVVEYDKTNNENLSSSNGVIPFLNLTYNNLGIEQSMQNLYPAYTKTHYMEIPLVFAKGVADAMRKLISARDLKVSILVREKEGSLPVGQTLSDDQIQEFEDSITVGSILKKQMRLAVEAFNRAFARVQNIDQKTSSQIMQHDVSNSEWKPFVESFFKIIIGFASRQREKGEQFNAEQLKPSITKIATKWAEFAQIDIDHVVSTCVEFANKTINSLGDDLANNFNQRKVQLTKELFELFSQKQALTELRKSSSIMPKKSAVAEIWDFAQENGTKDYYVTFTSIDKVGINPNSRFSTPIGVYTYPLDYVIKQINRAPSKRNTSVPFSKILPFAGDSPFLNILKSTGNLIDLANETQCDRAIDKLIQKFGNSMPDSEQLPSSYLQNSQAQTMWSLSMYIARQFKQSPLEVDDKSNRDSVRWNAIFRSIGVDAVSDSKGKGIIHPNEPCQAVFFHTGAFEVIKRIANTKSGSSSKVTRSPVKTPDRYRQLISSNEYASMKEIIINEVLKGIERACKGSEVTPREISNNVSFVNIKRAVQQLVDSHRDLIPNKVKPEEFTLTVAGSGLIGYTVSKVVNQFANSNEVSVEQAFNQTKNQLRALISKSVLDSIKGFYFKAKK